MGPTIRDLGAVVTTTPGVDTVEVTPGVDRAVVIQGVVAAVIQAAVRTLEVAEDARRECGTRFHPIFY